MGRGELEKMRHSEVRVRRARLSRSLVSLLSS